MTRTDCSGMDLLIQADLDGELSAAEAAQLAHHVSACPSCSEQQQSLMALTTRLRSDLTRYPAPTALRARIRAQLALTPQQEPVQSSVRAVNDNARQAFPRARRYAGWLSGAGFGVAATLAVMLTTPGNNGLPDQLVSDHIRALQPGHLIDVISTDQHTVKPWFDGRLDYAPPVRDLKADGFPLHGGRLDYMAGRPVAVLIYGRRLHSIDLYVWPGGQTGNGGVQVGSRNGYNFQRWSQGGMVLWAVSDIGTKELADFAKLWQTAK